MREDIVLQMIKISNEKLILLNKLLELTNMQKSSISESDMDKVDSILDEKDEIMKKIDALDVKFLPCFSELKVENDITNLDELDTTKYPNLKELKSIVKEITSTLMAISLLDDENNRVLKEELEGIKDNLKTVKKGQKAYNGYNKKFDNSIMIDEKK